MPRSGCSALHGKNPSYKKRNCTDTSQLNLNANQFIGVSMIRVFPEAIF